MKIILSRKGFDSQYGGQPSPILPDGTLLSFPIPYASDKRTFQDIHFKENTYFDLIRQLRPSTPLKPTDPCHLDPDLRRAAAARLPGWRPLFGQADAAQTHLLNQAVCPGDIFLFFGWFRQTELKAGKLQYAKEAPDVHLIYGYLQIGTIILPGESFPDFAEDHPHTSGRLSALKTNTLYLSTDRLSINTDLPGAGVLKNAPELVLTRPGMSRSRWTLPEFFKDLSISYHSPTAFKADYFQSVAQGQEFVVQADARLTEWTRSIISSNADTR